jgi:cytochrome b561
MRRRLLLAAVIAVIVILAVPALALADTAPSRVLMRGNAVITSSGQVNHIHMELNASGDPGWYLNLDLVVPVSAVPSNDERETEDDDYRPSVVTSSRVVSGSYTLGIPSQSLSSGTVTGTLDANLSGDISLQDQSTSTSLIVMFAINSSGAVTGIVEGQLPLIPPPAPPPTTEAVVPPVITVPAASTPPENVVPSVPEPTAAPPVTSPPAQSNSHTYWYISRTSAMAAYILLFVNICLGIGLKTKYLDSMMKRWKTFDLHQFTGMLAGALILLHIFSLLGDAYFKFSVSQLLVPGSSPFRPFWTALGSVSLYAGGVIALSYYVRKFIGQKVWKAIHYVSYLLFFAILFHGIMTGTDTTTAWVQWLYVATGTVVAGLFLLRFFSYRSEQSASVKPAQAPTMD